ncbi:MAG: hypothetical protein GX605_03810 [Chloroflexi bacterium]|nr:hypothetical protein [Chloroflexota bacterium]
MQDSDFLRFVRIIRKRLWLIILLFAVTMGVILYTQLTAGEVYQAQVRLQVLAAEPGAVGLYSTFRASGTSDEILATQNEFISVLQSGSVAWETIAEQNLSMSAAQLLDKLTVLRDADFVMVVVQGATPQEAEAIATHHVDNALEYYRTVRARPAVVSKEFLTRQIEEEGRSLAQAKSLLSAFKLKHNIDSVTREINSYQDLVRSTKVSSDSASVEAQRAARLAEEYRGAAAEAETQAAAFDEDETAAREERFAHEDDVLKAQASENAAASREAEIAVQEASIREKDARANADYYRGLARQYLNTAMNQEAMAQGYRVAQARYDQTVAMLQTELSSLIGLSDEYDDLLSRVNEARSAYSLVSDKLTEARLKESQVLNMGYIRVIDPARLPDRPLASKLAQYALAGAVVSLLLGVVLAFLLEGLESLTRSTSGQRRAG